MSKKFPIGLFALLVGLLVVAAAVGSFLWSGYRSLIPSQVERDEVCSTPIDEMKETRHRYVSGALLILPDGSTLAEATVPVGDAHLSPGLSYLVRFSANGEYDFEFAPARRCAIGFLVGADLEGLYLAPRAGSLKEGGMTGLRFRPYNGAGERAAETAGFERNESVFAALPRVGLRTDEKPYTFLAIWNPTRNECDVAHARLDGGVVHVERRAKLGAGECFVEFRPAPNGYAAGVYGSRRFVWHPSKDAPEWDDVDWDDTNIERSMIFDRELLYAGVVLGAPMWLKLGSGEGVSLMTTGRHVLKGPMADSARMMNNGGSPVPSIYQTDRLSLYYSSIWSIGRDGKPSSFAKKPPWDRR